MRTLVLAAFAVLLATIQVQAHCIVMPTDAPWQGASQSAARTLCMQRELSQATESLADEMRWKTELGTLAARTELLLQQQRAAAKLSH